MHQILIILIITLFYSFHQIQFIKISNIKTLTNYSLSRY